MVLKQQVSELEITNVQERSVLTTSKVFKPLKTFQLKRGNACQIVFSNYGGGFVDGDEIFLNINCHPHTTTVFSSQANTRVYKSETGQMARQVISGKLGEDSFTVFMGDPLVPQQNSLFEQAFHWDLGTNAILLLSDWFEAGRLLNQERFAFQSYTSECKVEKKGVPLIWDRFKIEPSTMDVNSPGAFLHHSSYVNIFLAGNENLPRVQLLETHLRFLARKYFQEDKPQKLNEVDLLGAATKVNEHVFMIRCSARNTEVLYPFMRELASNLEEEKLLGFNPLARRF